jgi:hypothetical protein
LVVCGVVGVRLGRHREGGAFDLKQPAGLTPP